LWQRALLKSKRLAPLNPKPSPLLKAKVVVVARKNRFTTTNKTKTNNN
jgi:hypothetical protein